MALARFKDLCFDAENPRVLGEFYARALGLSYVAHDSNGHLEGQAPEQTIWINPVPELKTTKHRVHVDVRTPSVHELEKLGATVLNHADGWTVMTDPEGGEFCAFERDRVDDYRLYAVIVDCAKPRSLATWWADVVGGEARFDSAHGLWSIEPMPGAPFESFVFVPVPEPKSTKNRIHWDVTTSDVDALLDRGATMLREKGGDIDWHVLADPEGNEFCAFVT
ncbi:hypothetical protein EF847_15885 [Actinobacteria bacterium YIM 96077]|uniref:Glyoxalase-like domain-containing protein n=1 Tax=Phytoactinopolyspora halophila TaxID=1981511 RepID=A0A329QAY2_9ACTN|nr:VOC family protein [Phytoactinopolyspora halophila]AYY13958.1 hypothetical protein EF847_15885 [Actinobacteria bacterium YIM 96077]RAW09397.1 hypothetical protein DPM12_21340 [Phytoactinopolyspora halophila]